MAVPAGQYIEAYAKDLAGRLTDVASQLYDLDQSASLAVLDDVDDYVGRTHEVLADVVQDRAWLWPAYTALRAVVDRALEHTDRREWDEARALLVQPLDEPGLPSHDDLPDLIAQVASTAKAILDVALLVAPKIGEHLGALADARAEVGRLEESAAAVGLLRDPALLTARDEVDQALDLVASDPLSVDPRAALAALGRARDRIREAEHERKRLPQRLAHADAQVLELEVLIDRGREALDRAREKIARPQGLLVPLSHEVINGRPHGLRPWLDRLNQAAAEGDMRAAIVGMRSWDRQLHQVREQAERVLAANMAEVQRRDELRGLCDALRAKASATGLAEDEQATKLWSEARESLWVAPCDLDEAEERIEAFRRFLAAR